MVLPEPPVFTSVSPFLMLPGGTYAMNPECGSRLSTLAGSCGTVMMRLPSGSVPPPGNAKRMRPPLTQVFGTVCASSTLYQTAGFSAAKNSTALPHVFFRQSLGDPVHPRGSAATAHTPWDLCERRS